MNSNPMAEAETSLTEDGAAQPDNYMQLDPNTSKQEQPAMPSVCTIVLRVLAFLAVVGLLVAVIVLWVENGKLRAADTSCLAPNQTNVLDLSIQNRILRIMDVEADPW